MKFYSRKYYISYNLLRRKKVKPYIIGLINGLITIKEISKKIMLLLIAI